MNAETSAPAEKATIPLAPRTVYFDVQGTCTITARAEGDSEYEAAEASQTFAVAANPALAITFLTSPPGHATIGETYDPRVISLGPAHFSDVTPSVCTLGATAGVKLIAAGTCTIGVSQFEATGALPPVPSSTLTAEQSFTVYKASQTIHFTSTPPSDAVAGGSYEVEATSSSPVPVGLVANGVCWEGTGLKAGEKQRLAGRGGESPGPTEARDGSSPPLLVHFVAAGKCTITAESLAPRTAKEVALDEGYEAAPRVEQSFQVGKDPGERITFTTTPPSDATVGGEYSPAVVSSAALYVSFSTLTPSTCRIVTEPFSATVELRAPGTCTVVASQAENQAAARESPEATQSFVIKTKKAATAMIPIPVRTILFRDAKKLVPPSAYPHNVQAVLTTEREVSQLEKAGPRPEHGKAPVYFVALNGRFHPDRAFEFEVLASNLALVFDNVAPRGYPDLASLGAPVCLSALRRCRPLVLYGSQ